jgi:hypothetical protein
MGGMWGKSVGIPGMVEEMNSTVIYLIYCKSFSKSHNVSPPNKTIKKK